MLRRHRPWLGHDWSSETLEHYFQRRAAVPPPEVFWKMNQQQSRSNARPSSSSCHGVIDPSCVDEIPPEIVGKAKIDKAYRMGLPWAREYIAYLLEDNRKKLPTLAKTDERQQKLDRTGQPKSTKVRQEMLKVLQWFRDEVGLLESANLKNAERSPFCARATMFAFPKPGKFTPDGQQMMRIVTDGRLANALSSDNVSFELFTLPALLQCVSNVSHASSKSKQWYCVNADFRHYFHQLPLPQTLRNLFLFECNNECFRCKAAPMGWYLSPVIAQAITWSCVLGYGWPPNIGRREDYTTMPSWIPFRNGIEGGIFVLLDNILVITNDKSVAEYWARRLKTNADPNHLNIRFKEDPTVTTIKAGDDKSFTEFLGINFWFDCWAVKEKNTPSLLDRGGNVFTHREISSVLGEILWDLRVRFLAPLEYSELMKVYSAVTPPSVDQWDDAPEWSDEILSTLKKFYAVTRQHVRCQRLKPWHADRNKLVCYAVDACGLDARKKVQEKEPLLQTAFVDMQPEAMARWRKAKHSHEYIGVAELEAIVLAVEDAVARYPHATMIVIITDSLCAKGWVERLYSDREDARELLTRLYKILRGNGPHDPAIRVSCVYVRSGSNISDVPSREKRDLWEGTELDWEELGPKEAADAKRRLEETQWLMRFVVSGLCHRATQTGHFAVRNERVEIPTNVEKDAEQ